MDAVVADSPKETKEESTRVLSAKGRSKRIRLTERDREIVRWVQLVGVTTREQVQKLFFGHSGRSRCQERLTLLVRNKFLDRLAERNVNAPAVYCLSRRSLNGLRLLRCDGQTIGTKHQRTSPARLQHTLDIVSCRVQLIRGCADAGMSLLRWLDEEELMPMTVRAGIIPDAYFQVVRRTSGGEKRSAFFLEVERSGKSERALKEKLRRYGEFYYGGRFEQAFGTRALRVLFLVGENFGIRPGQQIQRLAELAQDLGVTFFRFAPLRSFIEASAPDVLLGSIWVRPGASQLCSLFESVAPTAPTTVDEANASGWEEHRTVATDQDEKKPSSFD